MTTHAPNETPQAPEPDAPRKDRSYYEEPVPSIALARTFAEQNPDHVERLSKHQLIYSLAGLFLGLVCVLGGVALFINGIAGSTSWTAKIVGAESNISDAAPGAVLFIVGLFMVVASRYVLRVK